MLKEKLNCIKEIIQMRNSNLSIERLQNAYSIITIVIFIFTFFYLVFYFWTSPENHIYKLKQVIFVIIGIMSTLGIKSLLINIFKSLSDKFWINRSLIIFNCFLCWLFILPIHQIKFEIDPIDSYIKNNDSKFINHEIVVSASDAHKFSFERDGYQPDSMWISPYEILKSFNMKIYKKLKPKLGSLIIKSDPENIEIHLRKEGTNEILFFYSTIKVDSLTFGEYWVTGKKKYYFPESTKVQINSDSVPKKINLFLKPKEFEVRFRSAPNTEIVWHRDREDKTLVSTDIHGNATIMLPAGMYTLIFRKKNKSQTRQILIPYKGRQPIHIFLNSW